MALVYRIDVSARLRSLAEVHDELRSDALAEVLAPDGWMRSAAKKLRRAARIACRIARERVRLALDEGAGAAWREAAAEDLRGARNVELAVRTLARHRRRARVGLADLRAYRDARALGA